MLLQLNQHEHALLLDLLGGALGTLREEIYKTETTEFEAMLRTRETLLTAVLARLTAAEASGLVSGSIARPGGPAR